MAGNWAILHTISIICSGATGVSVFSQAGQPSPTEQLLKMREREDETSRVNSNSDILLKSNHRPRIVELTFKD